MSDAASLPVTDIDAVTVVNDPSWFPITLDPRTDTIDFVKTSAAEIESQAFVSLGSWNPVGPRKRLSMGAVLTNWPQVAPVHINFIWHTAFCASTLIARALDKPGRNLSLREPDVLSVLSYMARAQMLLEPRYRDLPRVVYGLLGRPFAANSTILIKPSPPAIAVLPNAVECTTGKSLFLHSDCRTFLIAAARGGETRRGFVRRLFNVIAPDGHPQGTWPVKRLLALSDLQLAALVWQMEMATFRRLAPMLGNRVASMDSDVFLKSPELALARLDDFFGLGLGSEHVSDVTGGSFLSQHAKTGEDLPGPWEHRMETQDIDPDLARDINDFVKWGYEVSGTSPDMPAPNALFTAERFYA